MSDPTEGTEGDIPANTSGYLPIFIVIAVLVFCAVGVSFMNLGHGTVYANLAIAATQASLLGYYFMHLKESERITWLCVGAGIFWLAIMFVLMLTDYLTRHIAAY